MRNSMEKKDLSAKQKSFCQEYLIDSNGTQAAIRAGYSAVAAQGQASRLLSNAMVSAKIAELTAEKAADNLLTSQQTMQSQIDLLEFNLADILNCNETTGIWSYKPLAQWPEKAKQICSFHGIDKQGNPIIRIDKQAAREALGKATGLYSDFNIALACLKKYGLWCLVDKAGNWTIQDRNT